MRFNWSSFFLVGASILQSAFTSSAQSIYGAVYHIDNNPTTNHVLTYKINADGTPSYANAYSTGGMGTSLTGGDPLFSQDSVAVRNNYLLTVNAGSNSVSLFSISPSDPTILTMLGSAMDSNGDYPVSVTFNAQATIACVLNGGIRNGFRCYTVSPSGLTPQPSWDRSTGLTITSNPPSGPPNTLSDITFSADGKAILVTAKITNGVFIYRISNGILDSTPIRVTPSGSVLPFSMTLIGSNGLLITDPGADGASIFAYNSLNGVTNAAITNIQLFNSTLMGAPCWSTYSPTTSSYYVIGAASASIAELSIDSVTLTPKLLQIYPVSGVKGILDAGVATVSGRDILYVVSSTPPSLNAFNLVSAGIISPLASIPVPMAYSAKTNQGLAIWQPFTSTSSSISGGSSSTSSATPQTETVNVNFANLLNGAGSSGACQPITPGTQPASSTQVGAVNINFANMLCH